MTRLRSYLDSKRQGGDKIVSIYLTAGYPTPDCTPRLLDSIVKGGADLIELGVPFSDPMADGPTIQESSQKALDAGITLQGTLDIASDFTKRHDIPLLLMGYCNPFQRFGWEKLAKASAEAGAQGFIVPDLPPEESAGVQAAVDAEGLSLTYLVSPNTPAERVKIVNEKSTGFIYAVSLTGVTGARESLPEATVAFLKRLRSQTDHPVLVGFGISNPTTAKEMSEFGDGVIIGSALIKRISESPDVDAACKNVEEFVRSVKEAV